MSPRPSSSLGNLSKLCSALDLKRTTRSCRSVKSEHLSNLSGRERIYSKLDFCDSTETIRPSGIPSLPEIPDEYNHDAARHEVRTHPDLVGNDVDVDGWDSDSDYGSEMDSTFTSTQGGYESPVGVDRGFRPHLRPRVQQPYSNYQVPGSRVTNLLDFLTLRIALPKNEYVHMEEWDVHVDVDMIQLQFSLVLETTLNNFGIPHHPRDIFIKIASVGTGNRFQVSESIHCWEGVYVRRSTEPRVPLEDGVGVGVRGRWRESEQGRITLQAYAKMPSALYKGCRETKVFEINAEVSINGVVLRAQKRLFTMSSLRSERYLQRPAPFGRHASACHSGILNAD